MDLTLDLPYPWSLSPAEALQHLSGGLFPILFGRVLVGCLVAGIAFLSTRQRPRIAVAAAALMGLLGVALAGTAMPALAAVLVVWATVVTYRGSPRANNWKLAVVVGLRLLALLLTFLTVLRPAFVYRKESKVPSVLIILPDISASMNFKDEYNNQTRFEAMQAILKKCEPTLKQLRDENQITIVMSGFAGETIDWKPDLKAEGKSSDYGAALATMYQRFGNEPNLRGVLVLGDGADNGRRYNAIAEARKWKSIQCPVNCFGLGSTTNLPQQTDLALNTMEVEPSPVYVKGRMIIRAHFDAIGCENATIKPHIFVEGEEKPVEKMTINGEEVALGDTKRLLSTGNELRVETTAPETPGEIRVTLKIEPIVDEVTVVNNEISTFVTVSKEGVSVLLVAPADEETKYIRQVLRSDPRIRLFQTTRQTDAPPAGEEADLFQFDRQAYDVIILRNVSAKRLSAGNPQVLDKIRELVSKKGVGFMMMGGFDSFGGTPDIPGSGDWVGTPIEDLLPVRLNERGQINQKVEFHPTKAGLNHYLLQMDADPKETERIWDKLNRAIQFPGINRLGTVKPTAQLLATTEPDGKGEPLMAAMTFNRGRTLAFAGDTTFLWRIYGLPKTTDGLEYHARFWKQTVLWLAQQENSEGNIWVKPDFRRLPAGQQQLFTVGARGKTGIELQGGKYEARITGPDGKSFPVPVRREGQLDRGQFWQTLQPGEYRIEATGEAKDVDGKMVNGKSSVRFMVFQDERELLQPAADMDFLGKVAAAGGGRSNAYRLDDLPDFLDKLKSATLPNQKVQIERFPDWRKTSLTPFLPLWLILFFAILTAEWALRRLWGMV